jgi:hypothetical protein
MDAEAHAEAHERIATQLLQEAPPEALSELSALARMIRTGALIIDLQNSTRFSPLIQHGPWLREALRGLKE